MIIFSGTGRSGTGLYSKLFAAHHEYNVASLTQKYWPPNHAPWEHEPFEDFPERIKIMTDHLSGVDFKSFRDSSNPYLYFLDALYSLDNSIKIVWGLRDGRDFVVSAITRRYYDTQKYGYEMTPPKNDSFFKYWSAFSPLEQMAWLWVNRNETGLKRLKNVPQKNQMIIRLEDLTSPDDKVSLYWIEQLEDFLHLKANREWLKIKYNMNEHSDFPDKNEWSHGMKKNFELIAGNLMKKFGYL